MLDNQLFRGSSTVVTFVSQWVLGLTCKALRVDLSLCVVVHDIAVLLFEHSLNLEGDGLILIQRERENVANCCAVGMCSVSILVEVVLFSKNVLDITWTHVCSLLGIVRCAGAHRLDQSIIQPSASKPYRRVARVMTAHSDFYYGCARTVRERTLRPTLPH